MQPECCHRRYLAYSRVERATRLLQIAEQVDLELKRIRSQSIILALVPEMKAWSHL